MRTSKSGIQAAAIIFQWAFLGREWNPGPLVANDIQEDVGLMVSDSGVTQRNGVRAVFAQLAIGTLDANS